MSKKPLTTSGKTMIPGFIHIRTSGGIEEYELVSNGLRVLYQNRPTTGVVTTNITYRVGARDEERGATGVAHMLEHMLFKPTYFDIKAKRDSASMKFEREVGCILNANTWKDRTTYFFSYPKDQLARALEIEAQRMTGVVLTDESLTPERNNVLSEFDMNNGDPHFALAAAMVGTAYHSHPYGHETIGYREDIERYTVAKLERFYRHYYRPDNATMMVIGDIKREEALTLVLEKFGGIKRVTSPIPRYEIVESKQEGLRRIQIERPSSTNIVSIGFKHAGFPSTQWFDMQVLMEVLTGGPESILHKALVDTGLCTSVEGLLEPTSEENLGMLSLTLAPNQKHHLIEEKVFTILEELSVKEVTSLLIKVKARLLTADLFARDSSLKIAAELTEYVAAGDWTMYTKAQATLDKITPKNLLEANKILLSTQHLTIGYFIGTTG